MIIKLINDLLSLSTTLNGSTSVGSMVHICHVCTTCQDDYPTPHSIPDMEDLAGLNSGAIMFKLFYSALIEPENGGWEPVAGEAGEEPPSRAMDAGNDPRMPPHLLARKDNPEILLKLVPVRCLSTCSAPHAVSLLGGPHKFSYQFGHINVDELQAMVKMINSYCESKDGYSSTRTRPGSLRGRVSARIPPMTGRNPY